jgi:hypothetical protein
MDGLRFDALIRSLTGSRRLLLGGGLAIAGGWLSGPHIAIRARKKRGKRSRLKRNAFGCVNDGGQCRGKDAHCCSGMCEGKRRKKDRSRCVAHNIDDCPDGADSCLEEIVGCTNGFCYQTTGQASFCASGGVCFDCRRDADCEPVTGPGAACGVCSNCVDGTSCLFAASAAARRFR